MLVLIWTLDALKLSGWVTFIAKYLETAFGLSAASANMMIGNGTPFLFLRCPLCSLYNLKGTAKVLIFLFDFGNSEFMQNLIYLSLALSR